LDLLGVELTGRLIILEENTTAVLGTVVRQNTLPSELPVSFLFLEAGSAMTDGVSIALDLASRMPWISFSVPSGGSARPCQQPKLLLCIHLFLTLCSCLHFQPWIFTADLSWPVPFAISFSAD
jgi:hypothetical protein